MEELKGKNWMATMSLCWFLGCLGAHRFYTGKQVPAIIMLVFTLTGVLMPISLIWAIVDGFVIALGKFKHADGSELYERIDWFGYVYIASVILGIISMFLCFSIILGAIIGIAGSAMGS